MPRSVQATALCAGTRQSHSAAGQSIQVVLHCLNGRAAFKLEVPCGIVHVEVAQRGADTHVTFESVESFASHFDEELETVRFDISFGGAFYAILPASRIGLSLMDTLVADLVRAGVAITDAVRVAIPISHPDELDLGFLYRDNSHGRR
jgi:proline racemase